MNKLTTSIILTFVLMQNGFAYAEELEIGTVGVVTKNTFLLSKTANVHREGKYVYGLIGYLPIGTRIYIDGAKRVVNNLSRGMPEDYYPITSSIGIDGLIRVDRFKAVTKNPIAIVVSSNEINLHNSNPKLGKWKTLLKMGKYGGGYLEIIGESSAEFYKAILHRSQVVDGLPMKEEVRVWKELVNSGSVIIVDPSHAQIDPSFMPKWSGQERIDLDMVNKLIDIVKDKLDKDIKSVRQFLNNADDIQCYFSADAKASVGFELFGTGLNFNLKTSFKSQDHMYRFVKRELKYRGDNETYTFLQNVKCEDKTPVRMQQLTIQEGIYNPGKRVRIDLKDLKSFNSVWTTSLASNDKPFRMITIMGEADYQRAISFLDKQISENDGTFLAVLPPEKKDILLNAILREISHFEHRLTIYDTSQQTS